MVERFVCRIDELQDGQCRIIEDNSVEVGVIRQGGAYYAYRNLCPHQGGPACEGSRIPQIRDVLDNKGLFVGQRFDEEDVHIVCPWHGYEYHLKTGEHVIDRSIKLRKYDVSTRDGGIYVEF